MQAGRERHQDGSLLHILILFSLSVAWPLFEQVSQSPEFLIARRAGFVDLILLVISLILIIPGLCTASIWLIKRWNHRIGDVLHFIALLLLFFALILIPFNRNFDFSWVFSISICMIAALLMVIGYQRYSSVRTFTSFLAPALVIVPCVFLMHDSISKLIIQKKVSFPQIAIKSSTPVVLVVFDEFPLTSILKDQETIDARLYPNFASLSKTMTWYRNATTVTDFTSYAIPSILTGRFPRADDLPIIYDHPANLFTALGYNYDLIAIEEGERLLPAEFDQLKKKEAGLRQRFQGIISDLTVLYFHLVLPREVRNTVLPPVDQAWANFAPVGNAQKSKDDRAAKFQQFVTSLKAAEKPSLFYLHSMFPHAPWNYLPSGKSQACIPGPEIKGYKGLLQCHLLTVGYVDRLIGTLIERLKETGVYDNCLLIITADHGTTFQTGLPRRAVKNNNFRDIMVVPLFIKLPHQTEGQISDLNVWTIDVLPTIADVLDVEFSWVEGLSVFDPAISNRTSKKFFSGARHQIVEFEPLMRASPETLAAQEQIIQSRGFQLAWNRKP
jgi:hypothetical protein